jgi:hypothetical protein
MIAEKKAIAESRPLPAGVIGATMTVEGENLRGAPPGSNAPQF